MKKTIVLALAAIMVLGVAGAAFAETINATVTSLGGTPELFKAEGMVTVNAKINPKIAMTITCPDDAAPADGTLSLNWVITPGTAPVAQDVVLKVASNRKYTLSRTDSVAGLTGMGVTATTLPTTDVSKGDGITKGDTDNIHTDHVNLTAADWWQVSPGDYTGTLTYTAVQK